MQHFKDRRAFETITPSQLEWARSILFDNFTEEFSKKDSIYSTYLTANEKKLPDKLAAINWLNLDKRKNLKILDIGTGCGHFMVLANRLGHTVHGTEITDSINELKDLYNHYNIDVFELFVERQKDLLLKEKYDIILSLRTTFNDGWSREDYSYFKDSAFRYLNDNGILFLKTNIKHVPCYEQEQVESAFGPSVEGWNNLTFQINK